MTLRSINAALTVSLLALTSPGLPAEAQTQPASSSPSPTTVQQPSMPGAASNPTGGVLPVAPVIAPPQNSNPSQRQSSGVAPAALAPRVKPSALPPPIPARAPVGTPYVPTGPVVTLDSVVAKVLAVNPSTVQSRLRLQRAHDVIGEATGQGLPQVRVAAANVYSAISTIGASPGVVATVSPVGTIPTVTDSTLGSVTSSGSSPLSSGTLTTSSGSGSTTTTGTTTTIIPVSPAPSSGASTGTTGTTSSGSTFGSSSSSGTATGQARPEQTTTTPASEETVQPRHNNYAATGTATQIIDIFGFVHANNDVAKLTEKFEDLDDVRVENDTALNAKNTYFAILKAQSDVATAQEQLANANAILNNAKINAAAGASPQFDVISAETQVSAAQQSLITAQNDLDVQRANMNTLLGQPLDTPLNVAPVTTDAVAPATAVADEINKAYSGRPELQQVTISQKIASDQTLLARQGMLPSLGLAGSVSYSPYVVPGVSHYGETIGLTASLSLFDGGQTKARVAAARDDEATQRSVAEQLRQNIALEVESALVNVIDAQALVASNQTAVTENREALRLANVRYSAGVGTLLEVTNAEANLANAENNLNSAIFQQQSAYAALLRAEGRR